MRVIISVKNVRLYWNNVVGVPCVKDTLSQKQFESIRSYLHFNNNDAMICDKKDPNYDRLYKMRPIIEHFNKVSSSIPYPRDTSVDENICATKMLSSLKQFNPWGLKLFMILVPMVLFVIQRCTRAKRRKKDSILQMSLIFRQVVTLLCVWYVMYRGIVTIEYISIIILVVRLLSTTWREWEFILMTPFVETGLEIARYQGKQN